MLVVLPYPIYISHNQSGVNNNNILTYCSVVFVVPPVVPAPVVAPCSRGRDSFEPFPASSRRSSFHSILSLRSAYSTLVVFVL